MSHPGGDQSTTAVIAQLMELVTQAMTSWRTTLRLSTLCAAVSLPILLLYLLIH
jgi:hypothetical protein